MTIMSGAPRPIETHYAGHRFRSRLEARWGVALDALGERWLYEPQGFNIDAPDGFPSRYLPDFYLPTRKVWVEVKGSDSALLEAWTPLLIAAAPEVGLPADPEGSPVEKRASVPRLLILGPVPGPSRNAIHRSAFLLLGLVDGDVVIRHCDLLGNATPPIYSTRDQDAPVVARGFKLDGHVVSVLRLDKDAVSLESARINYALECARSARFEHGEQPKVAPWRAGEPQPGWAA